MSTIEVNFSQRPEVNRQKNVILNHPTANLCEILPNHGMEITVTFKALSSFEIL